MGVTGTEAMHDSSVEESTFQLVMDQLEELAVTIIEEIRERPSVVLAIAAGIMGALVGARLARRGGGAAPERVARKQVRNAGAVAELAGTAVRLLQNPIVRGIVVAAIDRQLRRRLAL